MRVLGLAGPPGSGKSAVARALAGRPGVEALDLDTVAWAAYAPGQPAHARLVERFGETILAEGGRIDRARLARAALADPGTRRDLEAIVHPAVMERLAARVRDARCRGVELLLVEGALLASSPHVDRSLFDRIVWLEASDDVRRARLRSQGREHQVDRMAGVEPRAGTVVDAEGTVDDVARRVEESLER